LAELLGARHYSSVLPSLFSENETTFNYKFWADSTEIAPLKTAPDALKQQADAAAEVSIFRIKKGNTIQ
jgi:hypothetical protein